MSVTCCDLLEAMRLDVKSELNCFCLFLTYELVFVMRIFGLAYCEPLVELMVGGTLEEAMIYPSL